MFDALSYSESLAKIGVPQEQAKLQAKVLSKAFESNDLATKSDITELKSDVKADIAELKSDVKTDIIALKADITELRSDVKTQMSEMELRIIKWQIGGIGLVVAAIKFL